MKIKVLSIICLINISLQSTLTSKKYLDFVSAINKNDFQAASLIFSSLSLSDYSQRINNCVSIKNKLVCKKTSLNTEHNLGFNRTKEIEEVHLMLQKIEDAEKRAKRAKDLSSCCSIQ